MMLMMTVMMRIMTMMMMSSRKVQLKPLIIILIYPLIVRVVGAPQMI